jgi:hypothetical protein
MVLSLLSVSFRPYPKNWPYFDVEMLGTCLDIMGFCEQNRSSVIDTKVLFGTQRDTLGQFTPNYFSHAGAFLCSVC